MRAEGFVPPRRKGRGGSVSRRDHNQVYRRHAQLAGGTNSAEIRTSNANRSSGEGGWGRGASLREAASPPETPAPSQNMIPSLASAHPAGLRLANAAQGQQIAMHTVAEKVSADDPHTAAALKIISQNSQHVGSSLAFVLLGSLYELMFAMSRGAENFLFWTILARCFDGLERGERLY